MSDTFKTNLSFSSLGFSCIAENPVDKDQFFGAAVRGGLGYVLKRIFCVRRRSDCDNCPLIMKCIYKKLFEPVVDKDISVFRGIKDVPRPFVIDCSTVSETEDPLRIDFNFILIGEALKYYEYMIYAFIELGENGIARRRVKYKVKEVKAGSKIIYDDKNRIIQDLPQDEHTDSSIDFANNELQIEFLTPVRLKQNGRYNWNGDFSVLFKSLLRRMTMFEILYCGGEIKRDIDPLIKSASQVTIKENNLKWKDQRRYSTRKKQMTLHGGYIGRIKYSGNFSLLFPYLKTCESIHLGHNCTFGLGKYKINQEL